jgi:predicted nucleic acid-binding protein
MKQKIYLDTSVVGGYYDAQFEIETRKLFSKIDSGILQIVYSELTVKEIYRGPQKIIELFEQIDSKSKDVVLINKEIIKLADAYISKNVVGLSSRDDCIHIAAATISKSDYLLSWNFKHIVNDRRIYGYNAVNLLLGYPVIEIISPIQFNNDEKSK